MINCTTPRCLASMSWFGHPDDPALAILAKQAGWKVMEAAGWRCPKHQTPAALIRRERGAL